MHLVIDPSPLSHSIDTQVLQDISSLPTLKGIYELGIMHKIPGQWEYVAIVLGVDPFVNDTIKRNHPNDCVGACRDMLDRWLRGEHGTGEEERTWSTLLTALNQAGFGELGSRLRREHFNLDSS